MTPIRTAYAIGQHLAKVAFEKIAAEAALGDPNFWQGGTPEEQEIPTPAESAEEAIQLLPAGTFQGAQIKIQPDGIRNTTVKVSPDIVAQPDGLAAVFQAEPTAKVEIEQPQQQGPEGAMPPTPPMGTPMDPGTRGPTELLPEPKTASRLSTTPRFFTRPMGTVEKLKQAIKENPEEAALLLGGVPVLGWGVHRTIKDFS